MKRRIIAVVIGALCLLSSTGCSGIVVAGKPPCAEVKVDRSKSVPGVNKAVDNQLYAVTITYTTFGKAYAIGRDGGSSVDVPNIKKNPVKTMLPEGDYTLYSNDFDYTKCNDRFHV